MDTKLDSDVGNRASRIICDTICARPMNCMAQKLLHDIARYVAVVDCNQMTAESCIWRTLLVFPSIKY